MSHSIYFVDDDELPESHDFMLVMLDDGTGHLFCRRSTLSPQVLEESWAAYRAYLCGHKTQAVSERVLRAVV